MGRPLMRYEAYMVMYNEHELGNIRRRLETGFRRKGYQNVFIC
jgi:hypothetical protein